MNWVSLIVGFAIAAFVGAFFARLLERSRPGWSERRRLWTAASVLPAFILGVTLIGIVWILVSGSGSGENMQELAIVVTAAVGVFFALVTLVGGAAGASFALRRTQA